MHKIANNDKQQTQLDIDNSESNLRPLYTVKKYKNFKQLMIRLNEQEWIDKPEQLWIRKPYPRPIKNHNEMSNKFIKYHFSENSPYKSRKYAQKLDNN